MQYLNMLPYQIREAIEKNTPVVLPLGVIEYHAEHLPVGVDSFVAIETIRRVEERRPELVVLPPFYYGSASYAVAPPEGRGSIQVDSAHIIPVAEDIFRSLLRIGFRNIHCFIAHQTEEFVQGMPTDLAFKFAGRHTIFQFLEEVSGEGWWGREEMSDYYSGNNNPFAWIQVHPVRCLPEVAELYDGDHAGKLETSEMMAINGSVVEPDRNDGTIWFARPAVEASAAYGDAALTDTSRAAEMVLFGNLV